LSTRPPRHVVLEGLEARRLLSASPSTSIGLATQNAATPSSSGAASTAGILGYTPAQLASAYGFKSTVNPAAADGAGQTIAIVEAYSSNTLVADLQTFDRQFNLPDPPSLVQLNQSGGTKLPAVNNTWAQETALDVEWAHAVAPGANIVLVEANSDRLVDLISAVDAARRVADVSVVSMSWGVNEFSSETSFDYLFAAPAGHQNITFVASSGENTGGQLQWPAVSPSVVSVGGSTLTLADADGITVDAPWTATASGDSQYEPAPPFQKGSSTRGVPDVVYDGNPSTGFAVYDSGKGGWITLGGTSAGSPQWAALIAISDQIRSGNGQSTLDGGTQTLPQLYNYYGQSNVSTVTFASGVTAGALAAMTGGQGYLVINSLAGGNTTIQPTGKAAAAAPGGTTAPSSPAGKTAKLPKVHARPFLLVDPRAFPSTSVLSASGFSRSPASGEESRTITTSGVPLTQAAGLDGTVLSSASPSGSPVSTSMLNGAFSAASVTMPSATGVISEAYSGLFVATPGFFGRSEVVPVGADLSTAAPSPGYFYIAHLNATTVFCDAVSAFIVECAAAPPIALVEQPSRGHVRAWAITGAVTAIDMLVLHHLVLRRRRVQPRGRDRDQSVHVPVGE
jgi:hypothetical protein